MIFPQLSIFPSPFFVWKESHFVTLHSSQPFSFFQVHCCMELAPMTFTFNPVDFFVLTLFVWCCILWNFPLTLCHPVTTIFLAPLSSLLRKLWRHPFFCLLLKSPWAPSSDLIFSLYPFFLSDSPMDSHTTSTKWRLHIYISSPNLLNWTPDSYIKMPTGYPTGIDYQHNHIYHKSCLVSYFVH